MPKTPPDTFVWLRLILSSCSILVFFPLFAFTDRPLMELAALKRKGRLGVTPNHIRYNRAGDVHPCCRVWWIFAVKPLLLLGFLDRWVLIAGSLGFDAWEPLPYESVTSWRICNRSILLNGTLNQTLLRNSVLQPTHFQLNAVTWAMPYPQATFRWCLTASEQEIIVWVHQNTPILLLLPDIMMVFIFPQN